MRPDDEREARPRRGERKSDRAPRATGLPFVGNFMSPSALYHAQHFITIARCLPSWRISLAAGQAIWLAPLALGSALGTLCMSRCHARTRSAQAP